MVIPTWFPTDVPHDTMRDLLTLALSGVECFVDLRDVFVVVDGAPHVLPVLAPLRDGALGDHGAAFEVLNLPQNLGKGGAVAAGFERLLERAHLDLFCIRDHDGDHCIHDLPHLVALADQVRSAARTELVIVCGARADLHRPLGFERAEFEEIVAEVTWEALKFELARQGRALNSQWFAAYGRIPDVQSGYKVYTRDSARLAEGSLFAADRAHPDLRLLGWGVEVVPLVEVLLAGGVYAEVRRLTYERQPTTTFEPSSRAAEYAREVIWVFRRLKTPADVARQLLDNVTPRSLLGTTPAGREEVEQFRTEVLGALGLEDTPPQAPRFF